jgi:uncharacterized membrane protein
MSIWHKNKQTNKNNLNTGWKKKGFHGYFDSIMVRNIWNPSTYYRMLSTQSIQRKIHTYKLQCRIKIIPSFQNIWNFLIWVPFSSLSNEHLDKHNIKIGLFVWWCLWIYNYLCNQYLSPLMLLWGRISIRATCTSLCDKVCQ